MAEGEEVIRILGMAGNEVLEDRCGPLMESEFPVGDGEIEGSVRKTRIPVQCATEPLDGPRVVSAGRQIEPLVVYLDRIEP